MKPAHRTLSYTVYSPNYEPGQPGKKVKQLREAKREAERLGPGASIDMQLERHNKRRTIYTQDVRILVVI